MLSGRAAPERGWHPPEHETAYAWLLTVAVREVIKLDRRSRRLPPLWSDDGELPEPTDPRDEIQIRDEILDAAATVADARLTERERHILALHVAGYSYQQIAAYTGDSVRTVERQLLRARRKLRDALRAGGENHVPEAPVHMQRCPGDHRRFYEDALGVATWPGCCGA